MVDASPKREKRKNGSVRLTSGPLERTRVPGRTEKFINCRIGKKGGKAPDKASGGGVMGRDRKKKGGGLRQHTPKKGSFT